MENLLRDFHFFMKHGLQDIDEKSSSTSISLRLKGNVLMKEKNHNRTVIRAILTNYSKSIAYALPNSEELTFGYNNRSILMHHIKKYDLALIDINEALNITNSTQLKSKLLIRKISCLKAMGKIIEPSIIQEIKHFTDQVKTDRMKDQLQDMLKKALDVKIVERFFGFVPRPIPKMTRSREIPCASSAVELKYNETFGRHLTVNRYIPPGEILIVEDAYMTYTSYQERYLICSNCLDVTFTAVPCDSCPCIVYCSKLCKNDAWNRYHKIECSILQHIISEELFDSGFLKHLRNVIIALNENNFHFDIDYGIDENKQVETDGSGKRIKGFVKGQLLSNKLRCFCSLEDHKERVENTRTKNSRVPDAIEHYALTILRLLEPTILSQLNESDQKVFYKSHKWYALKELIEKIIRISRINSFKNQQLRNFSEEPDKKNIFDSAYGDLGSNIAVCCSLINHSCSPNVGRLFRNGKVIIFSSLPIKKDEQIFVTYRYSINTIKVKRQHHMRETYYFDCNCLACKLNLTIDSDASCNKSKNLLKTGPEDIVNFFSSMSFEKIHALLDGNVSNIRTFHGLKKIWPEYAKWKISQIFQKKPLSDALVETFIYEDILTKFYHEIYKNSNLLVEKCC